MEHNLKNDENTLNYIPRLLEIEIKHTLKRGKSILLFGARQTGKTTMLKKGIKPDLFYSFANIELRQRYEKNPVAFAHELEAELTIDQHKKLVAIDEIQKIPIIFDVIQDLIDRNLAQFILTGSSARKLKYGKANLLPGRVVTFTLHPLMVNEIPSPLPTIEKLLLYGALPGVFREPSPDDQELDLSTYVKTYLEEEVRAEAIVRNIGMFARFLELAANEAGNLINFSKLASVIGIQRKSIASYYQILEDCLIAEKIEPLAVKKTRRKLSQALKYLFFDLGVRRLCANEGQQLATNTLGNLFEQFVGLELIRHASVMANKFKVHYWRDHTGPEIDYVLTYGEKYVPIEVKWTDLPTSADCRHLNIFLAEYPNASRGFIVCRTPKKMLLTPKILAVPWQEISSIIDETG